MLLIGNGNKTHIGCIPPNPVLCHTLGTTQIWTTSVCRQIVSQYSVLLLCLPFKIQLTPHLFLYVLMRVSQIWVVGSDCVWWDVTETQCCPSQDEWENYNSVTQWQKTDFPASSLCIHNIYPLLSSARWDISSPRCCLSTVASIGAQRSSGAGPASTGSTSMCWCRPGNSDQVQWQLRSIRRREKGYRKYLKPDHN